jgi:hypothetical protein
MLKLGYNLIFIISRFTSNCCVNFKIKTQHAYCALTLVFPCAIFGDPSHGHTGIPQRSNCFFAGKDVGTIIASIYHMATSIYILDAQNSWHDGHNYRDRTDCQ